MLAYLPAATWSINTFRIENAISLKTEKAPPGDLGGVPFPVVHQREMVRLSRYIVLDPLVAGPSN